MKRITGKKIACALCGCAEFPPVRTHDENVRIAVIPRMTVSNAVLTPVAVPGASVGQLRLFASWEHCSQVWLPSGQTGHPPAVPIVLAIVAWFLLGLDSCNCGLASFASESSTGS